MFSCHLAMGDFEVTTTYLLLNLINITLQAARECLNYLLKNEPQDKSHLRD